jgi:hypothetical protein
MKTIIIVILAGLAVLATVYVLSAPSRTRIDHAYREFSTWTPDQISRDPVGYIEYCEQQTLGAIQKLKGRQIAAAQLRGEWLDQKRVAGERLAAGAKALVELKPLYRAAEAANKWPVNWHDREGNRDQTRKQIVKLHQETRREQARERQYGTGIHDLESFEERVRDLLEQANSQLEDIRFKREQLQVEKINEEQLRAFSGMNAVIETLVSKSDEMGSVNLTRLVSESRSIVPEEEFGRIMAEN